MTNMQIVHMFKNPQTMDQAEEPVKAKWYFFN